MPRKALALAATALTAATMGVFVVLPATLDAAAGDAHALAATRPAATAPRADGATASADAKELLIASAAIESPCALAATVASVRPAPGSRGRRANSTLERMFEVNSAR